MPYPVRQITVCPKCAREAVLVEAAVPPSVLREGDRIVWTNWELRKDETYFYDRYLLEYPGDNRPKRMVLVSELSSRAYIWLTTMPVLIAGLLLSLFISNIHGNHVMLILISLIVSAVPLWLINNRADKKIDQDQELVEAFWEEAAPQFHANAFNVKQMAMVYEICLFESHQRMPIVRFGEILRQTKICANAVNSRMEENGNTRMYRLMVSSTLRMLQVEDITAVALVLRLLDHIASVASGELPLAYADEVLQMLPRATEDREVRVRLRVLLCQKWFEVGWQPRKLHLMGKLYPSLGQAIASENESGLWNLYTLWKRGKVYDWKTLGEVETVFSLAGTEGELSQILLKEPDLLMMIQRSEALGGTAEHAIVLCEEGLFFDKKKIDDVKFTVSPKVPKEIVRKLHSWTDYYFETFQHYVEYYQQQEKDAYHELLWKQRLITCENCQTPFLAVPGEAGILAGAVV